MEADSHSFSNLARNWGYQSFWKRSEAYYNNPTTRNSDGFLIICTITSSPSVPIVPPNPPLATVPRDLLDSFAGLFNDPEYCDIVFRIRFGEDDTVEEDDQGQMRKKGRSREKKLYAAKKILSGRSEYFRASTFSFHEEIPSTRTLS